MQTLIRCVGIGLLGITLAAGLGSCCESCDSSSLGNFSLNQGSDEWLEFANPGNTRLFTSSEGRQITFDFSNRQTGVEDQVENCNGIDNCGTCCEFSYSSNFIFVEFLSENREFNFDLSLRKDFLRNTVTQAPETIDDYLSITFNNRINMEIFNIPDTVAAQNATINGKTFSQVFVFDEDAIVLNPGSKEPKAIYFTKSLGVVGFMLADGEEWSLDQ